MAFLLALFTTWQKTVYCLKRYIKFKKKTSTVDATIWKTEKCVNCQNMEFEKFGIQILNSILFCQYINHYYFYFIFVYISNFLYFQIFAPVLLGLMEQMKNCSMLDANYKYPLEVNLITLLCDEFKWRNHINFTFIFDDGFDKKNPHVKEFFVSLRRCRNCVKSNYETFL